MKKILLVTLFLFAAFLACAVQYESPMLNMTVPSGLTDGQTYLEIEHKFLRNFYQYPIGDDFFAALNYGSNIKIGLRYMIWQGIEAKVDYTSYHREKTAGLSYVLKTPQLGFNTQVDVRYFNYQDNAGNSYVPGYTTAYGVVSSMFYQLSMETVPFLDDRVNLALNLGYDGYEQNPGMGLGVSVEVWSHFRLLADYYPVLKPIGVNTTGCYSFGLKIDTSGHQFIIRVGNSPEIGSKDLMHGTTRQDIYLGFEIMRLIAF